MMHLNQHKHSLLQLLLLRAGKLVWKT